MKLDDPDSYGLGHTPMCRLSGYWPLGNLYLKIEKGNPNGSIKDRTAYYIVRDLIEEGKLKPSVGLVESSSGNLGLALAFYAHQLGVRFLCLVDPSVPIAKQVQLRNHGVEVNVVSLGDKPDYRTARIELARELDQQPDWIWTNQYDNPSNYRAHFTTTGPEIWAQMQGNVDYIVCSVGTGGTICGVGSYIKMRNPSVKIVAVEPIGSIIFGGDPGPYLSVGTGMRGPSGIIRRYGQVIDYFCKVSDQNSLQECKTVLQTEALCLGVSTGSTLMVARYLARTQPSKVVVAIAPDGGEQYADLFRDAIAPEAQIGDCELTEYKAVSLLGGRALTHQW